MTTNRDKRINKISKHDIESWTSAVEGVDVMNDKVVETLKETVEGDEKGAGRRSDGEMCNVCLQRCTGTRRIERGGRAQEHELP